MACCIFLRLNGYRLEATELDAVATLVALAAEKLTEARLRAWLKSNSRKGRQAK